LTVPDDEDYRYRCDLCGLLTNRVEVDHDHATDRIRGRICRRCNFLLGVGSDDPDLLRRAAEYLEDPPLAGSYRDYTRERHRRWRNTDEQRAMRRERMRRYREQNHERHLAYRKARRAAGLER